MLNKLKYLIAVSHFPKFGPVRINKLKKFFPDLESAFRATSNDLIQAGLEENIATEFTAVRANIDPDKIMDDLARENIKVITIDDQSYPKLLAEIYGPPPLLYWKGMIEKNDEFSLAVVGTRKFTSYGQQATENIVQELAASNITIISGLAYGIDSLAHNACLNAGGRTVAVLGSGLDQQSIYPSANRYLAEKIIDSDGLILSEFPLGTPPLRHNFPQRNRIISGLALGTMVVEAGEKSGALITARLSLEQNREVFAVPGSIYSLVSFGPNNLIKQGAKPVTRAADILEALDLTRITSYIDSKKIIPESAEEELIITHLGQEPVHVDELIRLTKLKTSLINSTLTLMEMKGMVKNLGGMQYVLAR